MKIQGTLTEARPKSAVVAGEPVKVLEMKVVMPYDGYALRYLADALGDLIEIEVRTLQETLPFKADDELARAEAGRLR